MSEHLSSRQFDECLIGAASAPLRRHLDDCPACREELQRLREPLTHFRESLRTLSEERLPPRTRLHWDRPSARWMPPPKLSLAAVAVALCLLFAVLFPWHPRGAPSPAVSDAALLSQIDAEVSRMVPGPMEPLTEFVSNDKSRPAAAASTAHQEAPE
jgi:anti-sigma factor RsiW